MLILHHNSFQVLFDKVVYVYFIWKIYTTLVSEMASVGNQHCAICIGTVLVPCVWCSVTTLLSCILASIDAVLWRYIDMSETARSQLLRYWLMPECCSDYLLSLSQVVGCVATRADFHRAMLATTPGEKLIVGCRPLRNYTQLQFFSSFHCNLWVIIFRYKPCVLCRKLRLFLGKSTKTDATRAALFTPDLTGGTALSQTPELYSRGLILKEARGQEFVLCPRKKKKKSGRVVCWL